MENPEESPKKPTGQPQKDQTEQQIPKQEWPVGDLPDPNIIDQTGVSNEDEQSYSFHKSGKSEGNGFDEWSSTWP